MAAVAQRVPSRRSHQLRVAALLEELEQRRRRLYTLKAYGLRPAGMRPLKAELQAVRRELAAVVDSRPQ